MSRYDLVTSRKYTTSNGEEKTAYHKIGSMFASRSGNGFSLKLDSLPLPNDKGEVWISAFEPRQEERGIPSPSPSRQRQAPAANTGMDDDIPF